MIINYNKNLQEQFSSFCKKNNPKNFEIAVEYFAVFGGLDVQLDMSLSLLTLIEKHILNKYRYLRNDVSYVTSGDERLSAVLSSSVLGDRRVNSTFKRCQISYDDGMDCVDKLLELDVISIERSSQRQYTSDKILIKAPFLRFWFAFISPIFKGIKNGEFEEFYTKFNNIKHEFTSFVFEQLSCEFIKFSLNEDKIYNIGGYWDDEIIIDLIAKTKSGKTLVGSCKYSDKKIKKSALGNLKESCEKARITPDIYFLFAKKGFSNELKSMKSERIKLFTCKSFKALVD